MMGNLKVIPPSEDSAKSHRVIRMRTAPSQAQIEGIVGGKLLVVPGFYTVLIDGEVKHCVAFQPSKDEDLAPNALASFLWFQARLRKGDGFAEAVERDFLKGTIVVVSGDKAFLNSFIWDMLLGPQMAN